MNGVHYHFRSVESMKLEIEQGKFVEYAEVHGNYYGTSIQSVETVQSQSLICLLDIDVQGAQNVKKSTLDAYYLFIAPPSMEELESRLRRRGTESEEAIQRRLSNARGELDYGMQEGNFDTVLVNNDLDGTLDKMVRKFKEWYPELLDSTKRNASETSQNSIDEEIIPPPFVDPLCFPKTDEGLKALLNEIDKDCPLESYVQNNLHYHASNIYIPAGQQLDIPLPPVEQDKTKIEWSVTLVDKYIEGLDVEFGLVVVVDGEEEGVNEEVVVVREMGRIVSPPSSHDDDGTDSRRKEGGELVSAKGKFTVASRTPVIIVMKLDNSYSWIKPKLINYSFNVISPVDENMIQRSLRAKSVFPKILEDQDKLEKTKADVHSRVEALARIERELEEKMNCLTRQIQYDGKCAYEHQKRADEAEEGAKVKASEIKQVLSLVKKEEQSIDECTSAIFALEEEIAKLKKKCEELKIERQVREEEKANMEKKAEQHREERIRLQEEIQQMKEAQQMKLKEIENSEKERSLLLSNLNDLTKEKKAQEEEEETFDLQLKFMRRQLDAVKHRFMERTK